MRRKRTTFRSLCAVLETGLGYSCLIGGPMWLSCHLRPLNQLGLLVPLWRPYEAFDSSWVILFHPGWSSHDVGAVLKASIIIIVSAWAQASRPGAGCAQGATSRWRGKSGMAGNAEDRDTMCAICWSDFDEAPCEALMCGH
eukprot:8873981-Pyramimonas_sp.AAC.1